MEKREVVLREQTTPNLWRLRQACLVNRRRAYPDGTRIGAENPDGSLELIWEINGTTFTGRLIDVMARAPDGRNAIVMFHDERTTHFGDLSLEEAEALFVGHPDCSGIDIVADMN